MSKEFLIITNVDPANAYSGLVNMANAIALKGGKVKFLCKNKGKNINSKISERVVIYNACDRWYSNLRFFRNFAYYAAILFEFLRNRNRVFIFHELNFFVFLVIFKKISKKIKVVHYATELYDEKDVPAHKYLLKFYEKFANVPDYIIECDSQRKIYRSTKYSVDINKIGVMINTSCAEEVQEIKKETVFHNSNITFVYSGGGYLHRELDRIIDGLSLVDSKINILLICYGPDGELDEVFSYAESKIPQAQLKMYRNLSRWEAISLSSSADVGVVYYRPSVSIGNKYAAPSKFFEYIKEGLVVLSSPNEGLVEMINDFNLGVSVEDESVEAIGIAAQNICDKINKGVYKRSNIKKTFKDKLSFNIKCEKVIEDICSL